MNNKVSVIIPMYNAEKYIQDCLTSVLQQTYINYEIIVIDDNSQDNSVNLVKNFQKQFSQIILICNKKNLGVAETRNYGIKKATGQWIAFLDADDKWSPTKLEKQIEILTNNNSQLCFTSQILITDNNKIIKNNILKKQTINYKSLLKQNIICLSSAIVYKNLCIKYSFTNPELHEDFIFWLNILKNENINPIGLIEPLTYYRLTKNSKTHNKLKSLKMTYLTYRKIGLNFFQSLYYLFFYILKGLKKYH